MFKSFSAITVVILISLMFVGRADAGFGGGPVDTTGEINGAPYRIVIPADWNGTLLVFGHGYRDKADHPGEVDNRNPDIAPNAALVAPLLAQGYALAGSAYRANGWEVEGGVQDMKDLTVYFRDTYGKPDRTILWAFSMGTVIALDSMERFRGIYDGALCGCAVGAGATQSWDGSADLALAYDVVFGMPAAWGTPGDVRDDVDFETEVQPKLITEASSPVNFPKFEFLRLVVGTPGRGITPPPPPAFFPGWLFTDMFFTTEARSELERRAGGPIVQNLDRDYNLTAAERTYLIGLGIPAIVIDGWLLQMNNGRIFEAPKFSRNYVAHNSNYSGRILDPILTMHTVIDPLVVVGQEQEYADTVTLEGREEFLKQVYTSGVGHCNFTGPQIFTALAAIRSWVETGTRPADSQFPAALGFVPGFVPPRMVQP
jgi:hypothetical protein